MYNLEVIWSVVGKKVGNSIGGLGVENKMLVYCGKEINRSGCGIIIGDMVKEGVGGKGVVIKCGVMREEYES